MLNVNQQAREDFHTLGRRILQAGSSSQRQGDDAADQSEDPGTQPAQAIEQPRQQHHDDRHADRDFRSKRRERDVFGVLNKLLNKFRQSNNPVRQCAIIR